MLMLCSELIETLIIGIKKIISLIERGVNLVFVHTLS